MKLVANLVLCALAFAAITDAQAFRRAEACDGGDPEPTQPPATTVPATTTPVTTVPATTAPATTVPATTAPVTTAPATTVPATTVPATTAPATTVPATTAPATTVPATTTPTTTVPATTVPATTVPATTVPATTAPATTAPATTAPATTAPATTAPATTAPATTAPAPVWDLTTPYVRTGVDCNGYLRIEAKSADTLITTNCVSFFSFYNARLNDTVEGCVQCAGTYDNSVTPPLCNSKPICGKIGDFDDLTQGEVACVIKANGSPAALDACNLGGNAVTPAPTTAAPTTPPPATSTPPTTAPTPTFPVTPAPFPTSPSTWDMNTPYDSSGIDCEGYPRVQLSPTTPFNKNNCVFEFSWYNAALAVPVSACLVCPGNYDTSVSPPLCTASKTATVGKPICGRIGAAPYPTYYELTQTQLKCIVDANGDAEKVGDCAIDNNAA